MPVLNFSITFALKVHILRISKQITVINNINNQPDATITVY